MQRLLITEVIRDRADFYAALGRMHKCGRPAPRNLDDLADFLRENKVRTIVAADLDMEDPALFQVLRDQRVRLLR